MNHLPLKYLHTIEELGLKGIIDFVVISCLLDAGAGNWKYTYENKTYDRSEGLAIASYVLFKDYLSDNNGLNINKLNDLDFIKFLNAFQVNDKNPLIGVESRYEVLKSLSKKMKIKGKFDRPGDIIDVLFTDLENCGKKINSCTAKNIFKNLMSIWPVNPDIYTYNNTRIPFWKLLQWTTYSVIDALEKHHHEVIDQDELTGLSEYRNGGLLLDSKVYTLKNDVNLEKE